VSGLGDRIEGGEYELSADERRVIDALKRVAKQWPETLWLYSADGTLCVMRKGEDGKHAMRPDDIDSVDQRYVLARIGIENSGGDW
jgi:hypothetical protein